MIAPAMAIPQACSLSVGKDSEEIRTVEGKCPKLSFNTALICDTQFYVRPIVTVFFHLAHEIVHEGYFLPSEHGTNNEKDTHLYIFADPWAIIMFAGATNRLKGVRTVSQTRCGWDRGRADSARSNRVHSYFCT